MSESYSVSAILSATDKNMTSTFNNATKVAETFGDRVKSIVAGLGVTKALSAATNLLTSSLDGAITRYDTLHSYPKVMDSLGYSTIDAEKSVSKLNAAVQGLPTSLADIVSSAQRITSVTGNMDKATDTAIALNNALLSSSASTEDVSRATQQYSQMLAIGKADLESWRTLQETMSPALTKVAKKLGIASGNTQELYDALKEGNITFDQFNDALIECNNETGGFADTAKSASKTIRTGFTNIKSAVENFEMSVIGAVNSVINSEGFGGIVDILDNVKNAIYNVRNAFMESSNGIDYVFKPEVLDRINATISDIKTKVTGMWDSFKATGAIEAVSKAIESVRTAVQHVMSSIDWQGVLNGISNTIGQLITQISLLVQKAADFVSSLPSGAIDAIAKAVTGLFEAFLAYKVVKTAGDKIKTFGDSCKTALTSVKSLYDNAKNLFNGLKEGKNLKDIFSKQEGIKDPTSSLVESSSKSASTIESIFNGIAKTINNAGSALKKAFQGVVDVVKSVGTSISTAVKGIGQGIKSAFQGVGEVLTSLGTAIKSVLQGLSPVIESIGTAFATLAKGIGEGISIALQGLGNALAAIPPTTWLSIGAAALMVGGALALVGSQGEGLQMVLNGVATVISSLSPIVTTIVNGIISVVSMLPGIFESVGNAVQTACEGIGSVIESLGSAIANVVTSVTDGMSTIIDSIGNAISGVLDSLAGIIDSIGNAALNAGKGFNQLANGIVKITELNIFDMGTSLAAVATGLGAIGLASGGVQTAASAMSTLMNSINSISSAVGTIGASFGSMASSCSSAVNSMMSSLSSAASKAKSTGQQIGNNVVNGVKSGMSKLPSTANQMLNQMYSTLNAAQSRAYQCGAFIGQGLANGLRSQVGAVQAAAAQLAAAADAAIRAKAKIGSPSKVADKDGVWIGKGLVNGLISMKSKVYDAAETLFSVPERLAGPNLSFAGMDASLSDDYSYYHEIEVNLNVPLDINGREFAKATYSDYQKVGTEKTKLNNRLKGVK